MKSILISLLVSIIAGVFYTLSYPSLFGNGWFLFLFVGMPLFLWRLEKASTFKESASVILGFNLSITLLAYYWIPHTLREFGQLPYVISHVLGLFFCLILQPHWWPYALWKKWKPKFNWQSEIGIILTAFIMTMMEYYFPQQFPTYAGTPWLHLAPYLGLAPFLGVVGFSFMTYWVCLEAITQITLKKIRPQVWIVFALFILINVLSPLKNPERKNDLPIRIVQANIGNFLKVESEKGDTNSFESIRRKYKDLSLAYGPSPKLIIWPETAWPDSFNENRSVLDQVFLDIMSESDSELLIGAYDEDTSKPPFEMYESIYNSSILISGNKVKTAYHKNILIPFGETLPFGPLNRQIVSAIPAIALFARGVGTPRMETKEGHRFVTPICYEVLETNFLRSLLNQWKNNHFIVNHTNDSWYGDTSEPYQHLFLAKWRAVEFQLPLIRSTNTGITSVIYPDGSESKRLGIGKEGFLDINLVISEAQNTIYQLYGIYPLFGIFLILLSATILRTRIFVKKNS